MVFCHELNLLNIFCCIFWGKSYGKCKAIVCLSCFCRRITVFFGYCNDVWFNVIAYCKFTLHCREFVVVKNYAFFGVRIFSLKILSWIKKNYVLRVWSYHTKTNILLLKYSGFPSHIWLGDLLTTWKIPRNYSMVCITMLLKRRLLNQKCGREELKILTLTTQSNIEHKIFCPSVQYSRKNNIMKCFYLVIQVVSTDMNNTFGLTPTCLNLESKLTSTQRSCTTEKSKT